MFKHKWWGQPGSKQAEPAAPSVLPTFAACSQHLPHSGGILVRAGRELSSPEESSRLSTGALIRQEELQGERLRYTRLQGTGPLTGWAAWRSNRKDKVRKDSIHGLAPNRMGSDVHANMGSKQRENTPTEVQDIPKPLDPAHLMKHGPVFGLLRCRAKPLDAPPRKTREAHVFLDNRMQ